MPRQPAAPACAPAPELRLLLASGNYNYIKDGAVFALNQLVKHLEGEGVPVMIVSPVIGPPAFESFGTVTGSPSAPLPGRPEYRLALPLTPALKRQIRAFRPTLVHSASPDPLGYSAIRFAKAERIPVVASYHARHDVYIRYYNLGFLAGVWQSYLRRLYAPCTQLYAPSQEVVELLKAQRIGRDVRLWGRGVDPARFTPARRSMAWRRAQGFADDDVVVTFVGRIVPEKNVDVMAAVFRELERRGVKHRQLVVGEGPLRPRLARMLPQARFTGYLDGDDLAVAYASSDVFFFPSITETFGIVTLEAMACGLPAVCARATGTQSLVVEGETGHLLDASDIQGFAGAIAGLAASPEKRAAFGAASLRRSCGYSWSAAMVSLAANYREALASAASTRT